MAKKAEIVKQAVNRNIERFPDDFMFKLTNNEANSLISNGGSQFVIPSEYNFGGTPQCFSWYFASESERCGDCR